MAFKIFAGLVAVGLLIAFLAPVAIKLKEVSLAVVIVIGVLLALWDLWGALSEKDE